MWCNEYKPVGTARWVTPPPPPQTRLAPSLRLHFISYSISTLPSPTNSINVHLLPIRPSLAVIGSVFTNSITQQCLAQTGPLRSGPGSAQLSLLGLFTLCQSSVPCRNQTVQKVYSSLNSSGTLVWTTVVKKKNQDRGSFLFTDITINN